MASTIHGCPVEGGGRPGTVVEVDSERAMVELATRGACGDEMSCGHCSVFTVQVPRVRVPRDGLDVGDEVRVYPPEGSGYLSMAFLFVLPPVLAVIGFVVGGAVVSGEVGQTVAAVAGGVLGLLVAAVLATLVNRKFEATSGFRAERV